MLSLLSVSYGHVHSSGDLQKRRHFHNYIKDHGIRFDIILQKSLINMYAKCGDMAAVEMLFERMANRDTVYWKAMVCGMCCERTYLKR
jgi:pentatricopeptide repeat protein